MPEEIAVLLLAGAVGTFTLIGLRMFLDYRVKRFSQAAGGDDTRHLEDAVASLRDEVYQLRTDVGELHERVEFTERVLAKGRNPEDR